MVSTALMDTIANLPLGLLGESLDLGTRVGDKKLLHLLDMGIPERTESS